MQDVLFTLILIGVFVFLFWLDMSGKPSKNTESKMTAQDILDAGGDWHDVMAVKNNGVGSPAYEQFSNLTGKK